MDLPVATPLTRIAEVPSIFVYEPVNETAEGNAALVVAGLLEVYDLGPAVVAAAASGGAATNQMYLQIGDAWGYALCGQPVGVRCCDSEPHPLRSRWRSVLLPAYF